LQVEVAFERIVDVDQGFDVRSAQLSPHCGDNFFRRNGLDKTQHVMLVISGETAPVPVLAGNFKIPVAVPLLIDTLLPVTTIP